MATDTPILLIQARDAGDPMLGHELECFAARAGLPTSAFRTVNLPESRVEPQLLDRHDVVMVGGAGDFSLVEGGFDWHDHLLETMRTLVRRKQPTFASCFGFQALARAFGGEVVSGACSELGTFEIELTDAGRNDPLFADTPDAFDANLGHNDHVDLLPDEFELLAVSERCPAQSFRVRGAPIVATQFHPELTKADNITRYVRYVNAYKDASLTGEEALARAEDLHRETPHSNELIRRFLEHV